MFYRNEYNDIGYDYISGEYVYGDKYYVPDEYMDERWWYIDGAPGYMISDCCRVWSRKTQQFIKPKPMDKQGHLGVCLRVNGRARYEYLHRLMAKAFLPNPHNKPVVRQLDDDTSYKYLDNLAWGTQKDNFKDCLRNGHVHFVTPEEREIGLSKMRTPILAIDIRTGERMIFKGQSDASRFLGVRQSNIWKVLKGQRTHTRGYRFEYMNRGDCGE